MEPNAFAPEFLDHFAEHDEPATSLEASTCGPWRVVAFGPERWGVVQDGEPAPRAVFTDRDLALLAGALLPASGRAARLVLAGEPQAQGFPVSAMGGDSKAETVGWLATFDAEALGCLHAGLHLAMSPPSLALLLEAAGPTALRRAGAILAERLEARAAGEGALGPQVQEPPAQG
ncbi:MAG TPA: hypothetical protein VF017_04760 [Thermoanaerobaculia bacterium]|nr:hypothetical protein [Thermoanaerobaculia bacterium]